MDRKTLRKYTGPAVAAGLVPGGPPMDEVEPTGARPRDTVDGAIVAQRTGIKKSEITIH